MATIKDVAKESGLSVGTVSRVLNNRGYISEETRNKVNTAMEKLNYHPNELARSLLKQKTNTIGVIVPHIVHPYFAKLISNLERAASDEGLKILLCNTREESKREEDYLDMCKSNHVSGIILCSYLVDTEKFKDIDIPVITLERNPDYSTASIECDNLQGGILAASHLIRSGCTRLLHFSGIANASMPADARAEGFAKVCQQNNIPYSIIQSNAGVYYNMEYHAFIAQVLKEHPKIDGIFASSDLIAAQVLQVAAKLSLSVPDKLKLVGFDDVNIASLTTPQITTIRQPIKEMAETAISFIQKANNGELVPNRTVLPVTLVKRETT